MSKNLEIIAEIITEQLSKVELSAAKLKTINDDLKATVEMASEIEINTKRLEEVIEHWNELFLKQKAQIVTLQKSKFKGDLPLKLTILGLTLMIIFLIFKSF
ncbi:hypothetical protein [Flavobacterium frigidarium]|uniref:hypothetical protein n=1 Tax=Flavobacterium frigidarium TaxID=99286 RepID=UPI0030DBA148